MSDDLTAAVTAAKNLTNDAGNAAKSVIVAWYAHPVPVWVVGVALLAGLLVGWLW